MNFDCVILNGFDRCGSSMISKVLAHHDKVNLLFQPFSSTEVHERQWKIDREIKPNLNDTYYFFNELCRGNVDQDFISSSWFWDHSSSYDIQENKLNIIKSTKIHFLVEWIQSYFGAIDVCGIWRNPRAIVCSLLRNDYWGDWYSDTDFEQVEVPEKWESLYEDANTVVEKMSLLVAIRTDYFFQHVDKRIVYETVVDNPNFSLNYFLSDYNLSTMNFNFYIDRDYNISGKEFRGKDYYKQYFSPDQIEKMDKIFYNITV